MCWPTRPKAGFLTGGALRRTFWPTRRGEMYGGRIQSQPCWGRWSGGSSSGTVSSVARHSAVGTRIALMAIASEIIALILIHPSIIHLKLVVAAMFVIALLCSALRLFGPAWTKAEFLTRQETIFLADEVGCEVFGRRGRGCVWLMRLEAKFLAGETGCGVFYRRGQTQILRLASTGEQFLHDEVGRRLFGRRGRGWNLWSASRVFVGQCLRRTL